MAKYALIGADIHNGQLMHSGKALVMNDGKIIGITDVASVDRSYNKIHLDGGTVMPGFVDLQVNGGGGVMFNDHQSVEALETIAVAHASLGTTAILPTLISDTRERTLAAIDAVEKAIEQKIPGIIGIHLEGPHLSTRRKGAHEPSLIRKMDEQDLNTLISAARRLPNIMVTVAPERVSTDQIATMSNAGIIVSLGHSDAGYDTCTTCFDNGATCTTHLFNAMSQLESREPGLVGATLVNGSVSAGLIADGIHVHPATIQAALSAKCGPGSIFLVTDAMSTVGSDITEFDLNGRRIFRRDGRLTLSDGTLAGADLNMPAALQVMTSKVGLTLEHAITMATSIPAGILNTNFGHGFISQGKASDMIYMDANYSITKLPGN